MQEGSEGDTTSITTIFKPFTRQSFLGKIKIEDKSKDISDVKEGDLKTDEETKTVTPPKKGSSNQPKNNDTMPDETLKAGVHLRPRLSAAFDLQLSGIPLEEIDPFYQNQSTFLVINAKKKISRYSSTNALWLLSPLSPLRRAAIAITTHRYFHRFIMGVIVINFYFLLMPGSQVVKSTEIFFTAIFTFELSLKVLARGFVFNKFSYLRDPWNWLDFILICLATLHKIWNNYSFYTLPSGQLNPAVLRTLRLIRPALKEDPVISETSIASALKNLWHLVILTILSIIVISVIGLQLYMGVLTQKCVANFPDYSEGVTLGIGTEGTELDWFNHHRDSFFWLIDPHSQNHEYKLCGNSTTASGCGFDYTCLAGFGQNPDNDYTSFDSFVWAMFSSVRLLTLDYWERLFQQVTFATGPWQFLFFAGVLFFGTLFLFNMFLAVVYNTHTKEISRLEDCELICAALEEVEVNEITNKTVRGSDESVRGLCVYIRPILMSNTLQDAQRIFPYIDDDIAETPEDINENEGLNTCTNDETSVDHEIEETLHDLHSVTSRSHSENKQNELEVDKGEKSNMCNCKSICKGFRKCIAFIIFDPFTQVLIVSIIVIDIFFMSLDHYGIERNQNLQKVLLLSIEVFLGLYTIEAVLKILALGPVKYWKSGWGIFEFVIVAAGWLEILLHGLPLGSSLQCVRPLRIFRLANYWTGFRLLLKTIWRMGNSVFIVLVTVFTFSVLGMQLYAYDFYDNISRFPGGEMPRFNFTDFWHAVMVIIRIICGEWVEMLWDSMLVSDPSCILFFIIAVITGYFIIFNLYSSALHMSPVFLGINIEANSETNNLARIRDRILRLANCIKSILLCNKVKNKNRSEVSPMVNKDDQHSILIEPEQTSPDNVDDNDQPTCGVIPNLGQSNSEKSSQTHANIKDTHSDSGLESRNLIVLLRLEALSLIKFKYYERAVSLMILLSCIAMAFEDIHLQENEMIQDILYCVDRIFILFFSIDILVKLVALGCNYFKSGWCLLDFIVTLESFVRLLQVSLGYRARSVQGFTFGPLRSLRALRAMVNIRGTKNLLNTIVKGIPNLFRAIAVILVHWLVFAIWGVQLFSGKFYKCLDSEGKVLDARIIRNRMDCERHNYTWANSEMNFDHIGKSYLSLFQIATFKGWISIMNDATDSRQLDEQPQREVNFVLLNYFVAFIVFAVFITRVKLLEFVFDRYRLRNPSEYGDLTMLLTEDQKKYCRSLKKLTTRKPIKQIPRPTWRPQALIFNLVNNRGFDVIILTLIGFNLLAMALDHYQQTEEWDYALKIANRVFIALYSMEFLVKVVGLRQYYFKNPWNVFDFTILMLCLIGLALMDLMSKYFFSNPLLFKVVHFARIGRILKCNKGFRAIFATFTSSFPELLCLSVILFTVMFIYAIFGMSAFMHLRTEGALRSPFNFQTFPQAMLLLFQLSTTAGWDGVLHGLMSKDDCLHPDPEFGLPGNCGKPMEGIAYLVSYIVLTYFIIIYLSFPIIMTNYTDNLDDIEGEATDDHYDMFYKVWAEFDPYATSYIPYNQLSDFIADLKPPFQIRKPNNFKIISLDIPICKGDLVHCSDILFALTLDVLTNKGYESDFTDRLMQMSYPAGYVPISSTLWRNREIHSARLIQKAWKTHSISKAYAEQHEEDKLLTSIVLEEGNGIPKVVVHSKSSTSISSAKADV